MSLPVDGLDRWVVGKQLVATLTRTPYGAVSGAAYDPVYGARPLRRYLQHTVETLIGWKIIADQVESGASLTVDVRDGELVVL